MASVFNVRVPRDPKDLTAQLLTDCFRDNGTLPSGCVAALTVKPLEKWNLAQLARLSLGYDSQTPTTAPRRLFAKIAAHDDPLTDIFPGEFAFYTQTPTEGLPLARCHGALIDRETAVTCLLLDDLTLTHEATPWPLPPSLPRCEAAVVALARIHAHWWHDGDNGLGADMLSNEIRLATFFQTLLPDFREALGDRLEADRWDIIRTAIDRLPDLKGRRVSEGRAVTRVHGDAHLWNVLYPKDPGRHGCVFIDWEDWRHDIAAADLAYMIALHWYPDRRRRHEEDLLRKYLAALQSEFCTDYGWEDLRADYRLGHLQNIVVPIFQQQADQSHGSWWPHLERWFLAFDDLDCAELL